MMDFKKLMEEYTGHSYVKVEVIPDPQVDGTYAIKADDDQYLVTDLTDDMPIEEAIGLISECEFESWPPVSGQLQFFL